MNTILQVFIVFLTIIFSFLLLYNPYVFLAPIYLFLFSLVCLFGLLLLIPYNNFFKSDGFNNNDALNNSPLQKSILRKMIFDHKKIRYKKLNTDYREGIQKKVDKDLDDSKAVWSEKKVGDAKDYINTNVVKDLVKTISKMDEKFLNGCIENYCMNHDGCRKKKACSRSWCVDTCKYWHGNKKWRAPPIPSKRTKENITENRIFTKYLNTFIEQKLKNVKKVKEDKGYIKKKDEADKERMLLAFCQTWKQASPEANPYIDSLEGTRVKPKIDEWGAAWNGLEKKIGKIPDKKDCTDLEMGNFQKEDELIIEEVEEELATFPEHDMSLSALQGFGKKGEPIGSSVIYEKIRGEVTDVDNLGLITTYPLGYKKISG